MQIAYDEQGVRHVEALWRTNKSGNKINQISVFVSSAQNLHCPFLFHVHRPLSLRWIFQLNLAPGDAFNNPSQPLPFLKSLSKIKLVFLTHFNHMRKLSTGSLNTVNDLIEAHSQIKNASLV